MNTFLKELFLYEKFALLLENLGWGKERIAIELSKIDFEVQKSVSTMNLKDIETEVRNCRACYNKGLVSERGPVPGRGKESPDILFVGVMPGVTEEETGKIFTGPNSKILTDSMNELGIGKKDCPIYAHNLVSCMPKGASPRVEQVRNCSGFLAALIPILQPNLIVTLGAAALSFFIGKNVKMKDYEGEVLLQGRYIIIPLKHPSALHRIPDDKERQRAFNTYKRQLAGVKRVNERIKQLREQGAIPEKESFQELWNNETEKAKEE